MLKEVFYTGTLLHITRRRATIWPGRSEFYLISSVISLVLSDKLSEAAGFLDALLSFHDNVVEKLLDLVRKMTKGRRGSHPHINDMILVQELEIEYRPSRTAASGTKH